jgi:hypothetical protein
MLDEMPNTSEWVAQALLGALGGIAKDTVEYRRKQVRSQVLLYEGAALKAKKELMALEEQAEASVKAQLNANDARLDLLETLKGIKNPQAWLESRVDKLAECDFKDAEEAALWVADNSKRMVR